MERAFADSAGESEKRSISEWSVLMTPEEAEQMMEEVASVVERYRDAGRAAGAMVARPTALTT